MNWAEYILTDVILMFILAHSSDQTGQNVQLTAPQTFKLKKEPVRIDCQPVGNKFKVIGTIILRKTTSTMPSSTLLFVTYDRVQQTSVITWRDNDLQKIVTQVIGTVTTLSSAQLAFTIPANNTKCSDEGTYTCDIIGNDDAGALTDALSKNVTAIVEPDRIDRMTAHPPPKSGGQYIVGINITLSCTGTVGSSPNPPLIVWCVVRTRTNIPEPVISTTGSQITNSEVQPSGTGSCQKQRTSTLVYTVRKDDTFTKFICQITVPGDVGICGEGTFKSTIKIETETTITTQAPGREDDDAVSSIGAIIGGVLGAIVFITSIVVVVVVFVICMQRRNVRESPIPLQSVTTIDTKESPYYSNEVHFSNAEYCNVNDPTLGGDKSKDYEKLQHQREMQREYEGLNVNTDYYVNPSDSTTEDAKSKDYEHLQRQRDMRTEYEGLNIDTCSADLQDPTERDDRRDDTYEIPTAGPGSYVNTF